MKTLMIIGTCMIFLFISSCKKETIDQYDIIIGVYSKDSVGNYYDTGIEMNFNSYEDCQIWSRTAMGDMHSSTSHLHYNAAKDVNLDVNSNTFTYTEYGPELDESSIQSTCDAESGGVTKSVNDQEYYQDKPNVFLKIKSIIKN